MEEEEKKEKHKSIATKVEPSAWRNFRKICKKKGISPYDMLQMCVYVIIRYGDDQHNLSAEMEQAMSLFEHLQGWKDALNLADPNIQRVIGEAIYFLYDPEGKKKGSIPVHVTRPFTNDWHETDKLQMTCLNDWQETANIQTIVERFFSLALPERYMRMRRLAVDMEAQSLLQLFDILIDQHAADADVATFRKEFEDARRSEWGKKEKEDIYKRKQHKDPDSPIRDFFHPNHLLDDE